MGFWQFATGGGSGGGTGDVVGPASSTDNAVARFDLATGKLLQNSAVTIADTTGLMTFPNQAGAGIVFYNNPLVGSIKTDTSNFGIILSASANNDFWVIDNSFRATSSKVFGWTAGTDAVAGMDTGLARSAAGVVKVTDGSTGIRGLLGGGTAVASATAMPLPTGRVFHVTGTTAITSITSTNFQAGAVITLIFDDVLTFTDGNNLKLAGDFTTSADDTITLAYDGTNWYECSRSVN